MRWQYFLVILFGVLVAACGREKAESQDDEAVVAVPPPTQEGIAFDVPSHPTGQYRLLRWSKLPNGHIKAVTRSDSPSGTIFSIKEINCRTRALWFLGQGETEEDASAQKTRDVVNELIEGSIQDVTVSAVCREVKK